MKFYSFYTPVLTTSLFFAGAMRGSRLALLALMICVLAVAALAWVLEKKP